MAATGIANALETLTVFTDFLPDPVKTPVTAIYLSASASGSRYPAALAQVKENDGAIADLADLQASISADVINELRGLTEAQIAAGNWVRKLADLQRVLQEVNSVFLEYTATSGRNSGISKMKKLWKSPEKQKEIEALKAKLDETRDRLQLAKLKEQLQRRLNPVFEALYGAHGSPAGCHPGTRDQLQQDLLNHLTSGTGPRVVWLTGVVGTGKSSVARSVCSSLRERGPESRLKVATFFIKRKVINRTSQLQILHTLMYQLARSFPEVLASIVRAEDADFKARIHEQIRQFLVVPFSKLDPSASTPCPTTNRCFIVIDVADERHDAAPSECDLIPCLLDALSSAGALFRVLITSRGEPSDHLKRKRDAAHDAIRLNSIITRVSIHDYDAQRDIRLYLQHELQSIAQERGLDSWPSTDQVGQLVQKSGSSFIYAATVIRWVASSSSPIWTFRNLLEDPSRLMADDGPSDNVDGSDMGAHIGDLYAHIIDTALDVQKEDSSLLRAVLGQQLHGGERDRKKLRGSEYYISETDIQTKLADKCINIMLATKVSYERAFRRSVEDLADSARCDLVQHISGAEGRYAYVTWVAHASLGTAQRLLQQLDRIPLSESHFWFDGFILLEDSKSTLETVTQILKKNDRARKAYALVSVVYKHAINLETGVLRNAQVWEPRTKTSSHSMADAMGTRVASLEKYVGEGWDSVTWTSGMRLPGFLLLREAAFASSTGELIQKTVPDAEQQITAVQKDAQHKLDECLTILRRFSSSVALIHLAEELERIRSTISQRAAAIPRRRHDDACTYFHYDLKAVTPRNFLKPDALVCMCTASTMAQAERDIDTLIATRPMSSIDGTPARDECITAFFEACQHSEEAWRSTCLKLVELYDTAVFPASTAHRADSGNAGPCVTSTAPLPPDDAPLSIPVAPVEPPTPPPTALIVGHHVRALLALYWAVILYSLSYPYSYYFFRT
ncbi:hypothetical protein EXIGLDRAFT_813500 [Exidia glandulosa HHB12029]|uniref:Nephrocystin 3-like N-terminal domain-containing protein n=1 Tax=Exidia glandulosa HHB12029 TaxID=1314781 RepID=A0A165L5A5_EXIGL|nr:hypothetical protein EXIGLDRAFT_813500 [Exidia glandulosa HHB12029]